MATNDIFGGIQAEIEVNGSAVINGTAFDIAYNFETKQKPAIFGGTANGFKGALRGSWTVSGSFTALYGEGGAGRAALLAAAASETPVTINLYYEGKTSGKPSTTLTAFISGPTHSVSAEGESQTMTCSWQAATQPTETVFMLIGPDTIAEATNDAVYSQVFTVTGGTPTYAFTVTGFIPANLTWVDDSAGSTTLSGTPTSGDEGTYLFNLSVTDSAASPRTWSKDYTLIINA